MSVVKPHRSSALVTGGARRIGRAIALSLAARGYDVAIQYQTSRDEAHEVVEQIHAMDRRGVALQADLSRHEDVERLLPETVRILGAPTVLINNASEFRDDALQSTTLASWSAHLDVNLRAPVFLAQAMVQHLPLETNAHIINIIDQRVLRLTPDFFSYTVSKAGLWAATRTMAQALSPRVRVNAIGPGPVLRSIHQTEADFAAECAATPLQRGSSPDEIAAAVGFILDSPSLTGQIIALDGGQHLA